MSKTRGKKHSFLRNFKKWKNGGKKNEKREILSEEKKIEFFDKERDKNGKNLSGKKSLNK